MKPLRKSHSNYFRPSRKPPAENKGVHPIVKLIWEEMQKQRVSQLAIADCTGINVKTFTSWFRGEWSPKLIDAEAMLNALGYEIQIVKGKQE